LTNGQDGNLPFKPLMAEHKPRQENKQSIFIYKFGHDSNWHCGWSFSDRATLPSRRPSTAFQNNDTKK